MIGLLPVSGQTQLQTSNSVPDSLVIRSRLLGRALCRADTVAVSQTVAIRKQSLTWRRP